MKTGNFVIVIGREFGAGGRSLGIELSKRLGVPYYDKELLSKASERFGFRPEIFDKADEKRPSLFQALLSFNYHSASGSYATTAMGSSEIYQAQSSVIRQIAEEGSCIIVGRTADYVLRDHPRILSVFLHADMADRVKAILRRGDCSTESEAEEMANKYDRMRREYYNYFTGRPWGQASNYDLSLNTSRLSVEGAANLITLCLEGV